MKSLSSFLALIVATAFISSAQTVATDPVGFVSYTVNANSDQKLGLPMQQATTFSGTASSVSGTTVNATGVAPLTAASFLLVTSGPAVGKWEQITASSNGSVSIEAAIPGFTSSNSFEIKPFWTLGTMFPNGGSLPKSTDVFDPIAEILMNNPSAVGANIAPSSAYFYFVGDADYPAGWYDSSNPDGGLKTGVLLSPDTLFTVRNKTGSAFTITMVGSVPADKIALEISGRTSGPQDNLIYNLFPADVSLANSGLAPQAITASTDIFSPGDQLLVYPLNNTGFNTAPPTAYFYFQGDADYPQGWYNSSDPDGGLKNNIVLPAGSGFVIRKAPGSPSATWNPNLPYALQ